MKDLFSEKLGMTLEEMEGEIEFMREWDRWMRSKIGAQDYDRLAAAFSREKATTELRKLGATENEAEKICDIVEKVSERREPEQ